MVKKRHLFVSYAREDAKDVHRIVDAVKKELEARALPVDIWMDLANLKPGEQWQISIRDALEASLGFLFFVSPRSAQSEWVKRELEVAARTPDRLIIPVILRHTNALPDELALRQWVDISKTLSDREIRSAAVAIVDATEKFLRGTHKPQPIVSPTEAPRLAAEIADEVRRPPELDTEQTVDSVFVVHGHDPEFLATIEEFLENVGLRAIVLSREDRYQRSLLEKFENVASQARFAIVLLSADDMGASRKQYEAAGVGERALQFRARQNVILELGFFYGRLGWEKVFIVYQEPDRVFPNFERPSDLAGAVFDSVSDAGWQKNLRTRLEQAGFILRRSA